MGERLAKILSSVKILVPLPTKFSTMKKCVLIAMLLSSLSVARAQTDSFQALLSYVQNVYQFSQICPQEKVFLHFDNTAYFQGDVIWFSAYVVNASSHTPAESKVLYVELLSPNGVVLKQLKLKVEDGRAHGSIPLVDVPTDQARALRGVTALPSGFYEVRAYTRTMLNFDDACVFSRVFPVYEAPEKEGDYSNPMMKRWDNPYDMQRPKTEKLKAVSLTFYPEGGHLVMGKACRVAFKAIDANGQGVAVSGELATDAEQHIAIETQHDGMGQFTFIPTKKRHQATVVYEGKEYTFRLPDTEDEAYALRVDNLRGQQIRGMLMGYEGCPDELLGMMLVCRGQACYFDTLSIRQGQASWSIPKGELPTGVHQLTLFNAEGKVLGQRQLFVNNGVEAGSIEITASAQQYEPFAKVEMAVRTTMPDGTPQPATISLAVRDSKDLGTAYADNMYTNMLLSSELKGYIHRPEYYFEANDLEHTRALDLLMMTQGWTRYNWTQMARVEPFYIKHYVEDGLVIDGYLLGRMKDKPVQGATVKMRLYSPDRSQTQEASVVTDENGSFGFAVEEFMGKWDMFLSATQDGKQIDCRMRLDRASRPTTRAYSEAEMYLPNHIGAYDTLVLTSTKKDPMLQADPDSVFLLDNVDVHGRKKYIDYLTFKSYNAEEDTEFHLDQGRYTYMVRDYLKDKGYNVDLSVYEGYVPTELSIRDDMVEWELDQCPINNRRVLWYLHNEKEEWHKSSYIPGFEIDMEDVKSIIVYDSPFDYQQLPYVSSILSPALMEKINSGATSTPNGIYVSGNSLSPGLYVVDITMYPKGLRKSKAKGQRQTTFRGYTEVQDYYAPEYPDGPIQGDVDYRRTLYWNPALTTGAEGEATVVFYNNGYSKHFEVSAEGITPQGTVMHGIQ